MLLTVLQLLFLAAALVGLLALAGWPTTLLVAGALGVVVCEVAERRRLGPRP